MDEKQLAMKDGYDAVNEAVREFLRCCDKNGRQSQRVVDAATRFLIEAWGVSK